MERKHQLSGYKQALEELFEENDEYFDYGRLIFESKVAFSRSSLENREEIRKILRKFGNKSERKDVRNALDW
jgi:hypothetical protein